MLERAITGSLASLSKREHLSGFAEGIGFTRLLEWLAHCPSIIVLNYHRISYRQECEYDRGVIDATPEQFDEQMRSLKRRYHMSDLEEVQHLAEKRQPLRHCHVLVTFDDGYRDGYDVALPILKARGVRATFFLTTAFIGTNRIPWWDQIAYMVRKANRTILEVSYPEPLAFDRQALGTDETIQRLLKVCKQPRTDPYRFLAEVERACDLEASAIPPERLFMSWEEAAALARAGMGIGSHTHRHEMLVKLTEEGQRMELAVSRDLLQEKLSLKVEAAAFPFGSPESFSAVTRRCLQDTGYKIAFSYYGGVNTSEMDPFNLLRIPIDPMSLSQYRLRASPVQRYL